MTTPHLCAGLIVEGGVVASVAPILRKKLQYWLTRAVRVSD